MFERFQLQTIDTGEATVRVRHGGRGPPLLLLHRHPQTHVMWHRVAPMLARDFSVVASDLRGYGDSSKPPTTPDHEPYSKRAMARDQVALMRHLGFERYFLGTRPKTWRMHHNLGGRVPGPVCRKKFGRDALSETSLFGRTSGVNNEIRWRLAPLDDPGLPEFIANRALPDPATARCELCDSRPRQPLSTILIVDGPDGLPVPFLICAQCRRTLDELHALLESAGRQPSG